jgi:tetratricopeptide (TPR) repeat protein
MRSTALVLLPVLSLASAACDGQEQPPAATAAAKAPAPAPTPVAAPTPAPESDTAKKKGPPSGHLDDPRTKPLPTDAEKKAFADEASSFAEHLAVGRKAVRAKDFDQAFESFEAARKLRPHDPTVLGESGFAALQAKKYELAAAWTRDAISRQHDNRKLGALRYNMGRIEEERGNKADAANWYSRSLAARDNETVRKRLEALGAKPSQPTIASAEAWCAERFKTLSCAETWEPEYENPDTPDLWWRCACDVEKVVENPHPEGEGAIVAAALVTAGSFEDRNHDYEWELLVQTKAGGWQSVKGVLNSWSHESRYEGSQEASFSGLRFVQLNDSGSWELVADYKEIEHAYPTDEETWDIDYYTLMISERGGQVVCGGDGPTCLSLPLSRLDTVSKYAGDDDWKTKTTLDEKLEVTFDEAGLSLKAAGGRKRTGGLLDMAGQRSWSAAWEHKELDPVAVR